MTTHKSNTIFAACCLVATFALFSFAEASQAITLGHAAIDYQDANLGETSGTINAGAGIPDSNGDGSWDY